MLTYEGLPESLKKECMVRAKVEEDPNKLKERQELIKNKSPNQLGQIRGLGDFPVPTLMRKRNLKSTKEKELQKRR